jgi:hypothetical protein
MKHLTLTLLGFTAVSIGCAKNDCDDTGVACDTGAEADLDEGDPEATFSVTWTGSSVDLEVTNADMELGYFFSLAETGAGETGWYGEDCLAADSICHDLYDTLSLACATSPDEVEKNIATLHCSVESNTTWAFWGGDDYETVVASGGDDPSYFGG